MALYVLLLAALAAAQGSELYLRQADADPRASLDLVRSLNLTEHTFRWDTVKNRRVVGLLSQFAVDAVPGAVTVQNRPVVGADGALQTLQGLHVVDSDTLTMHTLGAVAELARVGDEVDLELERLSAEVRALAAAIAEAAAAAPAASPADVAEARAQAEAEELAAAAYLAVDRTRTAAEVHEAQALGERMVAVAERRHELALERQALSDAQARAADLVNVRAMQQQLRAQNDIAAAEERERLDARVRAEEAALLELADRAREHALARARAKANAEMGNEDVKLREVEAQGEEERHKTLAVVDSVLTNLGDMLGGLLAEPMRLAHGAALLAAVAFVLVSVREVAAVARTWAYQLLAMPRLVSERRLKSAYFRRAPGPVRPPSACGLFLPAALDAQLAELAQSTRAARKQGAPLRNAILYGAPGTGKSVAARWLADESDLDLVVVNGSDVAPLGDQAAARLHTLFAWAKRSRRGVLVLVDEADAFAGSRSLASGSSEAVRGALNALLFHTSEQSTAFMFVMATSRLGDLDEAVLDRADALLHCPMPSPEARLSLLSAGVETHLRLVGARRGWWRRRRSPPPIDCAALTPKLVQQLAQRTDGFSGRELVKLVLTIQSVAYSRGSPPTLTAKMVDEVLQWKLKENVAIAKAAAKAASLPGRADRRQKNNDGARDPEVSLPPPSSPAPPVAVSRSRSPSPSPPSPVPSSPVNVVTVDPDASEEEEEEEAAAAEEEAEEEEEAAEERIERILAHRLRKGKLQFKVRWKGFGAENDEWFLATDLMEAESELVDSYAAKNDFPLAL